MSKSQNYLAVPAWTASPSTETSAAQFGPKVPGGPLRRLNRYLRRCKRGNPWYLSGKSMDNLWIIYGESMDNLWNIYG